MDAKVDRQVDLILLYLIRHTLDNLKTVNILLQTVRLWFFVQDRVQYGLSLKQSETMFEPYRVCRRLFYLS